ncbi:hypothetical protein [Parafrankia sp. BMG5.11]|uniref:hypothetical protein n=1 Tax=Parafrankia sp. BMG5.11 TaxID=222540 RepID=UPI0014046E11|nr:hypothetical protein [Parafrankia sp. BMG5.11]
MSLRAMAILFAGCTALAGLIVLSDPVYRFADWLRFALIFSALGYTIMHFRNRRRSNG